MPDEPKRSQVAINATAVYVSLLEEQLDDMTPDELSDMKSLLAARSNIHQTNYQDGLRKRPPENRVKNGALAEMLANLAFYAEIIRAEKVKPPVVLKSV